MKKGIKQSQEHIRKRVESRMKNGGYFITDEAKNKMRLAKLGKKRKPRSAEWCKKISEAKTGIKRQPFSREWRENMTKHGLSRTKFYVKWQSMIRRCDDIRIPDYNNYGGRGIKVCDRWHKFENFVEDMYKSYSENIKIYGSRNTSIDRINFDGDYEPSNCRWSTLAEQQRNRRNNRFLEYNGEKKTITEWARKFNMCYSTLFRRINRGMKIPDAFYGCKEVSHV